MCVQKEAGVSSIQLVKAVLQTGLTGMLGRGRRDEDEDERFGLAFTPRLVKAAQLGAMSLGRVLGTYSTFHNQSHQLSPAKSKARAGRSSIN